MKRTILIALCLVMMGCDTDSIDYSSDKLDVEKFSKCYTHCAKQWECVYYHENGDIASTTGHNYYEDDRAKCLDGCYQFGILSINENIQQMRFITCGAE